MVECVYREARVTDIPIIAKMNKQLIVDENHSNPMGVNELEIRMGKWLKADYSAFVVELNNHIQGYCLFRDDGDYIYIRQLFIAHARGFKPPPLGGAFRLPSTISENYGTPQG